jgi:Ca2+-binding RTX toxin-like protein
VIGVFVGTITENGGEGTDTLILRGGNTALGYTTLTLDTELENLDASQTTSTKLNLTGNASDNVLTGNAAANVLSGGAGNDTLNGGTGNDTLIGGTGDDTYVLGRGYGSDTVRENDATPADNDVAQFGAGIATDQLWLRHVGNNLEVSIIGTLDKLTFENWYLGEQYHVEQFKTANNKVLLDSQVDVLVQAMAQFSPPSSGQTTLPQNYQATLTPVIAVNWQ